MSARYYGRKYRMETRRGQIGHPAAFQRAGLGLSRDDREQRKNEYGWQKRPRTELDL